MVSSFLRVGNTVDFQINFFFTNNYWVHSDLGEKVNTRGRSPLPVFFHTLFFGTDWLISSVLIFMCIFFFLAASFIYLCFCFSFHVNKKYYGREGVLFLSAFLLCGIYYRYSLFFKLLGGYGVRLHAFKLFCLLVCLFPRSIEPKSTVSSRGDFVSITPSFILSGVGRRFSWSCSFHLFSCIYSIGFFNLLYKLVLSLTFLFM